MKRRHLSKLLILLFVVFFGVLTCIHPIYPNGMFLQHLGTLLILTLLINDLLRNNLTILAFSGIALFTIFHIIGARYLYSYVPYNEWSQQFFGININHLLGITRNDYDRFVHFSFGILFFPFLMETINRWKLSKQKTVLVSWLIIQVCSMIYELFEWLLTLVLSGAAAQNYNGQQGDIWDPQKDMLLALIGSSLVALFFLIKKDRNN